MIAPAGNLLGIGCDLCETDRIRGVWARQGDRFLEMVFTEEERNYCLGMTDPAPHLAARFAAKEAAAKAFGSGIGAELGWKAVSVAHGPTGAPIARLDEQARTLLHARGATDLLLTLSHTQGLAMAVAALVAAPALSSRGERASAR